MTWQFIHLYVFGTKKVTFDNFDGADLLIGIPVLYFFFTCPGTYFVSCFVWMLITGDTGHERE